MWNDVVDLRVFYAGPKGALAARIIANLIQEIWPNLAGSRVAGIGFPTPFFNHITDNPERILAVMPSGQGVLRWPDSKKNLTVLAEEQALPLADRSIDRLLLVHCLEGSSHLKPMLRECWRVLDDGGRLLVIVTNRRGLWSRAEGSPFAQGRPYSMGQITRLLRDNLFVPAQTGGALFVPPFWTRMFGTWAPSVEKLGARWLPHFAGLLAVEAEKQIYAIPFDGLPAKAARKATMISPVGHQAKRSGPSA